MNGIRYFFILLLFLIPGALFGQTVITLTTSGNFTVPCGVSSIQVECWGAGGGSGAGGATYGGSGGGGGAYASATLTVTPGQTIPYTIGAGGTAGPTGGGVAGSGGSTSWNGSVVLAIGGGGGQSGGGAAGAGGLASSSVGTIKYSGGSGFMTISTDGGGGGGSAGNTSNGNNATSLIGAVAVAGGGVGGDGQPLGTIGASPASGYGGGAGGAGKKQGAGKPGGAGAGGKIVVTYTQIPLAAGTYSIGPTGNYQSITQSITALCAGITGSVVFELQPDYTDLSESYPLIFTSVTGASLTNTITYRPASGAVSLLCDFDPGSAGSLINLNGASFFKFDGRPGGTGTNSQWTIRNTRTAATVGPASIFQNDASNDTLRYLNIEAETGAGYGIVQFNGTSVTTGNDNNGIINCVLGDLTSGGTATLPFGGVFSGGTAAKTNDNITISACQFIDIFNPAASAGSSCISVSSNSNSFTIKDNHIFQTTNFANLNTNTFFAIGLFAGGGHTVTGNYIGGRTSYCGGGAYTITSGTADFNGIKTNGLSGSGNNISGNTIANIAYTTTATSAIYPFVGILLQGSSDFTCGYAGNGNIIGSTLGTGSIVLTNNAASGSLGIMGIYVNATGVNSIAHNYFGGLSLLGSRTSAESEFIMLTTGNSTNTIDNNTFGNTTANNILINTNSILYGIRNTLTNGVTITNNTFQNITHFASTQALGIIYNSAGALNCSTNVFKNIRCASNINSWIIDHQPSVAATASIYYNTIQDISWENTGTSARFFGISLNSPTSAQTCAYNTIGSTSNLNMQIAGNTDSYAIYHSGTGTLTCTGNTIQEFNLSNSGTTGSFMPINCIGGTASVTWNTVKNIIINSSKAADVLNGINMNSSSTGHVVEKNKIVNLISNSTTADTRINGITLYSGTGTLSRNFIKGNENKRPSTLSSNFGIWLDAATWDIYNNIILLDNGSNVNEVKLYGIYDNTSTQAKKIHHNTIKLSGTASGGSTPTACLRKVSGTTVTINNNVFQNIRTGGSAGNYSIYMASAGMSENYNYLEVTENVNKLAKYDALDKTFAAWQTAAGSVNSVTGTITINDTGMVITDPFPGAGTGKNLTSIVPTDINGTTRAIASWMGAFEGQNITTTVFGPATYCTGVALSVAYTVGGSGAFNTGNIFTAQLSDATGSFVTPTNIGTLNSQIAGTISVIIPLSTPSGIAYRIRVISSDPFVTGSNNGSDITLVLSSPVTYSVTTTNDAGAGSLRQAITDANNSCGHDTIKFNLGAGGPYTITLSSALPNLTDNLGVTIDGFSQTGASANTIPVFNATGTTPMNANYKIILGNGANILTGLTLASNNNVIKGLVLQDFGDGTPSNNDIAINITGNNNSIVGCIIGMDETGTIAGTKCAIGIQVQGSDNSIGDGTAAGANLISGLNSQYSCIDINQVNSINNTIKGNMIGLQKDGSTISTSPASSMGVRIYSGPNSIGGSVAGEGNVISGRYLGVLIGSTSATGTTIKGNYIGTKADGVSYVTSNTQMYGIELLGSANNIIGGTTVTERNIVSANQTYGIYLTGAACSTNVIKGNYIGIDKNGTTFITGSTQDYGIYIASSAGNNNVIGGDATAGEGNVISGNNNGATFGTGVALLSTVGGNTVIGNIIGPQANGSSNVTSNMQYYGIQVSGSPNNVIGGNTVGVRNILSANKYYGLYFSQAGSVGNVTKGNYIGLDITGTTFISGSSQYSGVYFDFSSGGNIFGGTGVGDGNVISGNTSSGIENQGTVGGSLIVGNIIGPQADGTSYVTSNAQGIGIKFNTSANNIVGGSTANERNIISANETYGIYFTAAGCSTNVIKGNYIGIDKNGTSFIAGSSQDYGIAFETTSSGDNTIGGTAAGEGNIISGNTSGGIYSASTNASGNTIIGNIIGPQADGTSYLTSNVQGYGIYLSGSRNNTIGGNSIGFRNIISANEFAGLYLTGAACSTNVIKGNYIGIDKNGTTFITGSTQDYGIYITSSASNNTIGGDATTGEGNIISGNKAVIYGKGISIGSDCSGNSVKGNIIGPQADGVSNLASSEQEYGISISGSSNTIGGSTINERNVISANTTSGIYLNSLPCSTNVIKGNYIGLDATGTSFIAGSTQDYGIYITSLAGNNTIGGDATLGEGNVISGNSDGAGLGRGIFSNSVNGNSVRGNIIGPQSDGLTYVGSNDQNDGIYLDNTAGNSIGGSTVAYRNVISGNESTGIYMFGAACSTNTVTGNYIGSASDLSDMAGSNQDYGIYITSSAANNTIGTTTVGDGNTILHNSTGGIYVNGTGSISNKISGNSIYENMGKPVDLNYGASQANSGKAAPVITQATSLTIGGTAAASDIIEIYKNTSSDCYDATTFITSVTADGSGNWTASVNLGIGDYIMATAHDASNNTSEFSTCTLENPEFFWVGDGGDWTNFAAHWAKSSGGVTFWSVPPPSNSLIRFDSNSCGGLGHIINMDIDTQVKEIDFRDVNTTPTITGTGVIIVGP